MLERGVATHGRSGLAAAHVAVFVLVVSDGELKAGGSYPHRMFGSPVASARCEVHMLHVRWSRRAVPCQELALLFVSVSFKIGWPFGRTTFDSTVDSLRASR